MATLNTILSIAAAEIGVTESPRNSNRTKYGAWYGMNGQPWCAMFVSWVFDRAGSPLPVMQQGAPSGAAYCPFIEHYAKRQGRWYSKPQPGDLALFHFGKREAIHIGIVETVMIAGQFNSIEGNTSATSNDNGGAVMRRSRNVSQCRGFYRPVLTLPKKGVDAYYRLIRLTSPYMRGHDIAEWQKQINWFKYGLDVDGEYGPRSMGACKAFQRTRGLAIDGVVGPITWAETFKKLN
ncbi:CHAP domain-containing protein [Synechocystis sp. PCC 7339]|uniref:C40 family peptidase n=1 Tax=Synechocystis sp. PCC 7339 TaxID=2782213 RepID=UPI001CBADCBE|nr:peptidoglycan-binding protein [Synechocystis sp. PCC 7339]UAJ73728.1 CHAP domain-containing protein [Synechocystis sp. PCC 7339]